MARDNLMSCNLSARRRLEDELQVGVCEGVEGGGVDGGERDGAI